MGAYQQMIANATGEKDPEIISEIEEGMRVMTGGILSNLTNRGFDKLARQVFEAIKAENS
jgi:hypothetical protein